MVVPFKVQSSPVPRVYLERIPGHAVEADMTNAGTTLRSRLGPTIDALGIEVGKPEVAEVTAKRRFPERVPVEETEEVVAFLLTIPFDDDASSGYFTTPIIAYARSPSWVREYAAWLLQDETRFYDTFAFDLGPEDRVEDDDRAEYVREYLKTDEPQVWRLGEVLATLQSSAQRGALH